MSKKSKRVRRRNNTRVVVRARDLGETKEEDEPLVLCAGKDGIEEVWKCVLPSRNRQRRQVIIFGKGVKPTEPRSPVRETVHFSPCSIDTSQEYKHHNNIMEFIESKGFTLWFLLNTESEHDMARVDVARINDHEEVTMFMCREMANLNMLVMPGIVSVEKYNRMVREGTSDVIRH